MEIFKFSKPAPPLFHRKYAHRPVKASAHKFLPCGGVVNIGDGGRVALVHISGRRQAAHVKGVEA